MVKRIVEINGQDMKSEEDFHRLIASAMNFPEYYGENLDALWDSLSGHADTDVILRWKNSRIARENLGSTFDDIIEIFEDNKKLWKNFEYRLD